jgi:excisionase family DNA binding protein
MSDGEPQLLTVKELAQRLNVPVSWVYLQAERGLLPSIKLGRYTRFDEAQIREFLETRRQGGRGVGQ